MRILILSATVGSGHMSAADALKFYILRNCPKDKVAVIDAIESVDPKFNGVIVSGYSTIVKNVPPLFSFMYKSSNKESAISSVVFDILFERSGKLLDTIAKFTPDAIISTHPFCAQMLSILKNRGKLSVPSITVLTDYEVHKTWINHGTDAYVVSHDNMVDQAVSMGAIRSSIYTFGIPVNSAFFDREDRALALKRFHFNPSLKTVLIMCESCNGKETMKVYNELLCLPISFQIIIMVGKDKELYEKFTNLVQRKRKHYKYFKPTKLVKYTKEVYLYMSVADVLVTKPGGLTISEALAADLPMLLLKPIPGQEEANKKFLLDNHTALDLCDKNTKEKVLHNVLACSDLLEELKQNCKAFDTSHACERIVELAKDLHKEYKHQ